MNTCASSCRTLCLAVIVSMMLLACGYKGPLYMPPSVTEPVGTVTSSTEKTNNIEQPAAQQNTRTTQKKVVNQ